MKKLFIILVIFLIIGVGLPFLLPDEVPYLNNLQLTLSSFITLLLPFIFLSFVIAALLTKHLHVQLERMNIGGINLLFRKPDKIFIDSAKAFLETKRTLYHIDGELDNFYETLDSYYATYKFIRQEMSILDTSKEEQKALYDLSSKIIAELNFFLTKYQNNYRRWYTNTIEDNYITVKKSEKEDVDIKPHMMRIGDIQKYYYDYNEMLEGFIIVNDFFKNEVSKTIDVDHKKWEREWHGFAQNLY